MLKPSGPSQLQLGVSEPQVGRSKIAEVSAVCREPVMGLSSSPVLGSPGTCGWVSEKDGDQRNLQVVTDGLGGQRTLVSLLWMAPGRNCTVAVADSPKYRAGLWFASVKWSLCVQGQWMVSGPCLTSAREYGSQSLVLFKPPARYLSSAFSFSGFSSRLIEI